MCIAIKDYTRSSSISVFKRERDEGASTSTSSPSRRKTRLIAQPTFNFRERCMFCDEKACEMKEKKKPQERRRKINHVLTLSFKDSIIARADERGDNFAKAVKERIFFEHDLVAAKAKYHHECYLSFIKPSAGGQADRPEDNNVTLAMEDIFLYIETNDDYQFTITELKNVCRDFIPNEKTNEEAATEIWKENNHQQRKIRVPP